MDTKRNQTLEEIEENKIVSEHYQNRIKLIKELLKTSQLVIGDLCVHINISEASYHRYTNFTSYMKTDIFIHACIFLKQYICLLYTSPSTRDGLLSRMQSSA